MAGDWIKMRGDLQTHPKVVRILSALNADICPQSVQKLSDKFRVIGGLHAVWSLFDAHSETGELDGYTAEVLDSLVGFPGITAAMALVEWIEIRPQSLALPQFETHNGQSAKRRAQDADRKKTVRKMSAFKADKKRTREEKSLKAPLNPKSASKKSATFSSWITALPDGEEAIPADHHVFAYAKRVGIPEEFLALAWTWFERRYSSVAKRYSDWPKVFRNAVEGNWGKLWWIGDDGAYKLTTAGVQLQREVAMRVAA